MAQRSIFCRDLYADEIVVMVDGGRGVAVASVYNLDIKAFQHIEMCPFLCTSVGLGFHKVVCLFLQRTVCHR